jgi:acetyl esterase/lipase
MTVTRLLRLATRLLLLPALLAGCDRLAAFNSLQAGSYTADLAGLSYGDNPRQRLDLYFPAENKRPAPLIVWFYGGSWDSGAREKYAFVAKRFTEMGYAVAIPDYRLVPDAQYPAFVEDGAMALAFLMKYRDAHPGQLAQIPPVLAGHSAGAYNALQMVANPAFLTSVDLSRDDIAGIIGLSGPYDFYPYDVTATQTAFGTTPANQSQPVDQDLTGMPPMLLITGDADKTVFPRNSIRMAKLAPDARLVIIPGASHIDTVIGLGTVLTGDTRIVNPIADFLQKVTHTPQTLQATAAQ